MKKAVIKKIAGIMNVRLVGSNGWECKKCGNTGFIPHLSDEETLYNVGLLAEYLGCEDCGTSYPSGYIEAEFEVTEHWERDHLGDFMKWVEQKGIDRADTVPMEGAKLEWLEENVNESETYVADQMRIWIGKWIRRRCRWLRKGQVRREPRGKLLMHYRATCLQQQMRRYPMKLSFRKNRDFKRYGFRRDRREIR